MKHRIFLSGAILSLVMLAACKDEQKSEDLTSDVNKNGSVETSVSVQALDSTNDILVTKHTVWVKGTQFKTLEYRDTVPSLGIETKEAESGSVTVKKDYEIFITVK